MREADVGYTACSPCSSRDGQASASWHDDDCGTSSGGGPSPVPRPEQQARAPATALLASPFAEYAASTSALRQNPDLLHTCYEDAEGSQSSLVSLFLPQPPDTSAHPSVASSACADCESGPFYVHSGRPSNESCRPGVETSLPSQKLTHHHSAAGAVGNWQGGGSAPFEAKSFASSPVPALMPECPSPAHAPRGAPCKSIMAPATPEPSGEFAFHCPAEYNSSAGTSPRRSPRSLQHHPGPWAAKGATRGADSPPDARAAINVLPRISLDIAIPRKQVPLLPRHHQSNYQKLSTCPSGSCSESDSGNLPSLLYPLRRLVMFVVLLGLGVGFLAGSLLASHSLAGSLYSAEVPMTWVVMPARSLAELPGAAIAADTRPETMPAEQAAHEATPAQQVAEQGTTTSEQATTPEQEALIVIDPVAADQAAAGQAAQQEATGLQETAARQTRAAEQKAGADTATEEPAAEGAAMGGLSAEGTLADGTAAAEQAVGEPIVADTATDRTAVAEPAVADSVVADAAEVEPVEAAVVAPVFPAEGANAAADVATEEQTSAAQAAGVDATLFDLAAAAATGVVEPTAVLTAADEADADQLHAAAVAATTEFLGELLGEGTNEPWPDEPAPTTVWNNFPKGVSRSNRHAQEAMPVVQPPGSSDFQLSNVKPWEAEAWQGAPLPSPMSSTWNSTVAICAVMKDEQLADVMEWIQYHRWIGVSRIFLRENGPQVLPAHQLALQPYIDAGFLVLDFLPGPKHPLQNRWYNRCSKPDMAGAYSWAAFLDLDEFMVVLDKGQPSVEPHLGNVLAEFKEAPGLSLQWVLFGSSGHEERPKPGGPLAHYTRCTGVLSYQMKCVANMFWAAPTIMAGDTVHDCTYRMASDDVTAMPSILSDGTPLRMLENTYNQPVAEAQGFRTHTYIGHLNATQHAANTDITPRHRLAIFHYVTRSLEEYSRRKAKLPSGIYAHRYAELAHTTRSSLADPFMFARFEADNGFDGTSPICSSIAHLYPDQCCTAV